MLSAEQLQMRLLIHVSHHSAAQLLWSASRFRFHRGTNNVHGSVTQLTCEMHFQLCNRLSQVSTLLFSVRANELNLENEVSTLNWKLYMKILQPNLQVILFVFFVNICCNLRLIYYPATPILNPPHTPKKDKSKVESRIIIHAQHYNASPIVNIAADRWKKLCYWCDT